MTPFVRFVLLTIGLGVILNLSMVLYSTMRSSRNQALANKQEEQYFEQVIGRFNDRQRRMDILVQWQRIDARGKVLETSILIRRYLFPDKNEERHLPVVRVAIPGDRMTVDGMRLIFSENITQGDVRTLQNKKLAYFDHVYSEEQNRLDRFSFQTPYQVPLSSRVHVDRPSPMHYEIRLWSNVWEMIQNPQLAAKRGLQVIRDVPATRVVKNGTLYSAYLGNEGISIEPREDPDIASDMFEEAESAHHIGGRAKEGFPGVRIIPEKVPASKK